jgi:two-component system LytT family sensor kinase
VNRIVFKPWFFNTIPLLVWCLLLALPFLSSPPNHPTEEHSRFLLHILLTNLLLLAIFYIHTYLLYPLLKQKGFLVYFSMLIVLIAAYWCAWWFLKFIPTPDPGFRFDHDGPDHHDHPPFNGGPGGFLPVLSTVIVLLCSFCYRIILDNNRREELLKEKETSHLRTELNFLRSQVNPHFLFNILNSLTSLARKRSDQLEPAIVSLSQIMRYMLYDSLDNRVPLIKEVEYLQNYISLQQLRFGHELTVDVTFSKDIEGCLVEPMLFIPLVENAFKYGTGKTKDNLIIIDLLVPEDKSKLYLKVVNFYDPANDTANEGEGIGLKNIQRRLELLYPGRHDLSISANQNLYIAELSLKLN